ncbi:hypothetical protein [Blastochloris tepida]|jgi:hypothetical protein|uniref:Uncharacterized protein n=1 Tax=Blastochloris tepida TaxID=2233851 RepID=A0A348FWJ6_9HYPH|nr:hypothetical protein [Blastochloris tepida]BBF91679.1 hypothetical protein BLTE_03640 [Blastochloris tepida]
MSLWLRTKTFLVAGLTGLVLAGGASVATSVPAEAQYYGPRHYGPRHYGPRPGPYYGPRPYYGRGYYRGWDNGGAVAAGVLGGLALGALAAQPRGVYVAECWIEQRRVVTRSGRVVWRDVEVCP